MAVADLSGTRSGWQAFQDSGHTAWTLSEAPSRMSSMPTTGDSSTPLPLRAHDATAHDAGEARLVRSAVSTKQIGTHLARIGLAIVIGWIGCLKFLAYEAEGVRGLIENSPLMSWMYAVWSVQGASNVIGTVEVTAAVLILLRPVAPRAAAVGSLLAIVMFLTTLSFLFTTPGVIQPGYSFPALSGAGGFLIKDIVLLGVAVWSLGDALEEAARQRARTS